MYLYYMCLRVGVFIGVHTYFGGQELLEYKDTEVYLL